MPGKRPKRGTGVIYEWFQVILNLVSLILALGVWVRLWLLH